MIRTEIKSNANCKRFQKERYFIQLEKVITAARILNNAVFSTIYQLINYANN